MLYGWLSCLLVERWTCTSFSSLSGRCCVKTLGKFLTPMCNVVLLILYRVACCVPRLTQRSTLRGTVKRVSAFKLSNNKWRWWTLGLQPTGGLTAQVGWLGLKVMGQLALPCICPMNRVNSRSDFVTMTVASNLHLASSEQ